MGRTPAFDGLIHLLQEARRRNLKAKGEPPPLAREQARWTRRRFMRVAGAAGGTAAAASVVSCLPATTGAVQPRVVVVGAGIAGLNAAYQLQKAGVRATVFEGRRRLGGRIFSVESAVGDGLITELGGSFINSDHQDMRSLADELDLELFDRLADARRARFPQIAYYFEGRRRDEEEVAEALRPMAAQLTEDADRLDQDFDAVAPEVDALSVKDYLELHADKIGEPFIRTLLENVSRTEYGVEPEDCSALQLIFELPTVDGDRVEILSTSDERFVVQGGNNRIIEALGAALAGQIELRRLLRRIEARGAGFRLTFAPDQVVDADYVIVAIPFTTLRDVQIEVDIPAGLGRFIREVDLGRNEKLIGGFAGRPWRDEGGFVLEAWTDLDFAEVWDASSSEADRAEAALTFFLGGDQVARTSDGGAQDQGRRFADQLDAFLPGIGTAANGRFVRTRWTRDPLSRGAYTNFRPGQLTTFGEFLYVESDDPGEARDVHVGNLVFAGEQLSDAHYGFMNGGAETGRLAAQVVLRRIAEHHATDTVPVEQAGSL